MSIPRAATSVQIKNRTSPSLKAWERERERDGEGGRVRVREAVEGKEEGEKERG